MGTEIERKFLVTGDGWRNHVSRRAQYRQGYLPGLKTASVRVRTAGARAWLNIKSATINVTRREYEYSLPMEDAQDMLDHLCEVPLVEKTRYFVPNAGHTWEVDVFEGENAGLVVAEIELQDVDEAFSLPDWAGEEVSEDPRYYNVSLVNHPYSRWEG